MTVTRKWVIFEFGEGSFETGFPVTVRIGTDGVEGSNRIPNGWLPPAPKNLTESSLEKWKQNFEEWIQCFAIRGIKPSTAQVNQVGINVNFPQQTEALESQVKEWLKKSDETWQKIIEALSLELNKQDEIRIIIQTDNYWLRQLPWQVWRLFSDHDKLPRTEFSFSPSHQNTLNLVHQKYSQVKILVILGESSEGETTPKIDYKSDIDAISRLGAEVEFLAQPTRKALVDKLWEKSWQIIFYSGHSNSENDASQGYLLLRQHQDGSQETISIDNLKESLTQAITNGLQLAIFNSCDGLGVANQLQELSLPQIIVMRNKVPDRVAQDFLQDFLKAFAGEEGNRSLHDALREARKKIKDNYDDSYPGMSWNPVIFQQYPDTMPLTWMKFGVSNSSFDGYEYELDNHYGSQGIDLFISYAHEDKNLRDELKKQLSSLERKHLVNIHSYIYKSCQITLDTKINLVFDKSRVIILLLSPDFIRSDFCRNQIDRAEQKWKTNKDLIIPIRLRPVNDNTEWFSNLKPLPSNNKAVTEWDNCDKAFKNIAEGIEKAILKRFN